MGVLRRLAATVALSPTTIALVVAAVVFGFVAVEVEPPLVYHSGGLTLNSGAALEHPVFRLGGDEFIASLRRPGGLLEYAGAWLWQQHRTAWRGAAVLASLAGSSAWLLPRITGALSLRSHLAAVLSAVLLAALFGRYDYRLACPLGWLAALALLAGWLRLDGTNTGTLRAGASALSLLAVAAWLLGGFAVLFGAWAALVEWSVRRRFVAGAIVGAATLATALLLEWPLAPPGGGVARQLGFRPWSGGAREWLFVALDALVVAVIVHAAWHAAVSARRRGGEPLARPAGWFSWAARGCAVAALAAAALGVGLYGVDRPLRARLRAEMFARTGQWSALLDVVDRELPGDDSPSLVCDINRALFETGRMPTDLFRYPQRPGALLARGENGAKLRGAGEVLLELGCVNEAEHVLHETLELEGPRPRILKLLAMVHLARGRTEAAKVFLSALAKDVAERRWAESVLVRLQGDPLLADDPAMRRWRAVMIEEDTVTSAQPDEVLYQALLRRNPRNRMAFEYLMAHYLLTRRPGPLVAELDRLGQLGYARVPELYAEAAALHQHNIERPIRVLGRPLPAEAVERVARVVEIARRAAGDRQRLDAELAVQFPASVSRYFLTGRSGIQP